MLFLGSNNTLFKIRPCNKPIFPKCHLSHETYFFLRKSQRFPFFRGPGGIDGGQRQRFLRFGDQGGAGLIPKPSSFFSGTGDNPTSKQIVPCFFMVRADEFFKNRCRKCGFHLILFSMGNIITCECKLPTKSSCERHRSVLLAQNI